MSIEMRRIKIMTNSLIVKGINGISTSTGLYRKDDVTYLNKDAVYIMKKVCEFVTGTSYFKPVTVDYIMNPENNIKKYCYEKGMTEKEYIAANKAICRDGQKFKKDFGDMYHDLVILGKTDIEEYEERYFKVIMRYRKSSSIINKIDLKLESHSDSFERILTDEEFDRLIKVIAPYTKVGKQRAVECLSGDMIGYLNYLSISNNLSNIDATRLQMLRRLL